jgi:hypothetical protein
MARAWISDGSVPVFEDTVKLRTSHKGMLGLPIRYEGFVDDEVGVGSLRVQPDTASDVLFAEAEWYVELGTAAAGDVEPETPVILRGFIEGKWMNRLLGTHAWKPASVGNNVIADGPGIPIRLGELEAGISGAAIRLEYDSPAGPRVHSSVARELRGHNIVELVREVVQVCRAAEQPIDGVNLGAVGLGAAVVNEQARIKRALRADSVPLLNPLNLRPHRAKERLVGQALEDGLGVPPGGDVTLTTRVRAVVVGRAVLTLESGI